MILRKITRALVAASMLFQTVACGPPGLLIVDESDNSQVDSGDPREVDGERPPATPEELVEILIARLNEIEDPDQRDVTAVYTLNTMHTMSRLASGLEPGGDVERRLSAFVSGLAPDVRAELAGMGAVLDALPTEDTARLLGRYAHLAPGPFNAAPPWGQIGNTVIFNLRQVPHLRANFCSGNVEYADGTLADRAVTVGSEMLFHSSEPEEFGPSMVAATASPVITGLEGEALSVRHPALEESMTTPISHGVTPFGVETGIPCSVVDPDACDADLGLICSTKLNGGSSGTCMAYPVVHKDQDLILRGFNFWDIDEARLVLTPVESGEGREATMPIRGVETNEPDADAAACRTPTAADATHNRAHFTVTANQGHFYKITMYNHNGNFFTQEDADEVGDPRVIHVCYPESQGEIDTPDGTVRDCQMPTETCAADGAECAAEWGTPPRPLEECRHDPSELPVCGETPEWFGSELLTGGSQRFQFGKQSIVYVIAEEPQYTFSARLETLECAEETGIDILGSDEPMVYLIGLPTELPPDLLDDTENKLDDLMGNVFKGGDYDSGDRKVESFDLSTVDGLGFDDEVIYLMVLAEDDSKLTTFLAGAAVIVAAAAVIVFTGGAALWATVIGGTAGATALWAPISAALGEDDLLGTAAFRATPLDFIERIAASHTDDFLTQVPPPFGALPRDPAFAAEGEVGARLIHPVAEFSLSEEPLEVQCNPGTCPSGQACEINRCVEVLDTTATDTFRERREFEMGGGHYAADLSWRLDKIVPAPIIGPPGRFDIDLAVEDLPVLIDR